MQIIDNLWCLLGDEISVETRTLRTRETNVELKAVALKSRKKYRK